MPKTANQESYRKKYSEESLMKAIEEVHNGMSKREACRKYKIPRATIQFRLSEKFTKTSHGPSPILTAHEEDILIKWIKDCQRKGFPRRKEDIQISVKQFLDDTPRENPFKDNLPGDGWYKAFMKRHPDMAIRKSEGISTASAAISEQDIRKWFDDIHSYLRQKGYDEVLEHPERIFNADETNFQLCPQNKRVIAPKGTRNVYEVDSGKAKTTLTVLFTFSAAGNFTQPLIIYPGKRLRKEIGDSIPDEFTFTTSDTGWMKTEIFYEYVANSFYPYLKKAGIQFPVILFVDGHKTHIDRKLSDLCTNLGVILIALYPNATRILQPADVSTFKPLKDGWRKGIIEWRRSNLTEELSKKEFAGLLKVVISKSIRPEIIINGFKACGLYPWNPNSIDFSKCLGKKKTEYNKLPQPNDENFVKFSKFKEIIGSTRVNLFTNMVVQIERNEDQVLYQLWKEFQNTNTEVTQEEATNTAKGFQENLETKSGDASTSEKYGSRKDIVGDQINDVDILSSAFENKDFGRYIVSYNLNDPKFPDSLGDLSDVDVLSAPIVIERNGVWHEINIDTSDKSTMVNSKEINKDNPDEIAIDIPNGLTTNNSNEYVIASTSEEPIQKEELAGTIDQYLHYPNTPQRKGKKNSEKCSFILSSSSWKRFHDEKELKKQAELEGKENRKREREQKKVAREKAALEKISKKKQEIKRPKKVKNENKKDASLKKTPNEILRPLSTEKNIRTQEVRDNSYVFLDSSNTKKAEVSLCDSVTTKAQIHHSNETNAKTGMADFENTKIKKLSNHIQSPSTDERKLINITKKLQFEDPDNSSEQTDLLFNKDQLVFVKNNISSGLCFSCTRNITFANAGVRCENCTRSYHLTCIQKYNLHKSNSNIFLCQTCLKRRKN